MTSDVECQLEVVTVDGVRVDPECPQAVMEDCRSGCGIIFPISPGQGILFRQTQATELVKGIRMALRMDVPGGAAYRSPAGARTLN